jgi:uncharacterized protein YutE (UPF0331/DUF86 family)
MVNKTLVQRKLSHLEKYYKYLLTAQNYSEEDFSSDPLKFGSVERFLQLSIEIISDLGNHVVGDKNLGDVSTYSDIPRCLLKANIINEDQADTWIKMAGFRNILVHEYAELDRKIVFNILHNNIDFIKNIMDLFAEFLD